MCHTKCLDGKCETADDCINYEEKYTPDPRDTETVDQLEQRLWAEAKAVPGGYHYAGICSDQLCFYLRDGGELRLMVCEADNEGLDTRLHIDFYNAPLPPGITGPVWKTGS